METSVRVLVANRPRLLRELVLSTLSEQDGISIVGQADNEKDVPSRLRPRANGGVLRANFRKRLSSFFLWRRSRRRRRSRASFYKAVSRLSRCRDLFPAVSAAHAEEDIDVAATINRLSVDIVWVGLSTPKQERWMFKYQKRLTAPVLVGVGAAFDFHTGRIAQAPFWMREHGLEWFFRLCHEPRRQWRRYLVYGVEFAALVVLETLHLKKFP